MYQPHEKYIGLVVVALVIAGGSFWGGMKYQQSRTPAPAAAQGFVPPEVPAGNATANTPKFGSAFGHVIAVGASSVTVQSPDGKEETIALTSSTTARLTTTKTAIESPSAIKVGDTLIASGPLSANGTIQAQSISISEDLSSAIAKPPAPPALPRQ